jgi:cardiolipin synthase
VVRNGPIESAVGRRQAGRSNAVPNLVTAIRLVLVAPIVALVLWEAQPFAAAALAAVFAASDWVDGFLARRLGQVSCVGAFLDPLADRAGIACIAMALGIVGAAPWWVLGVFPVVDLVIGGVYVIRAPGRQLGVVRIGKARTAVAMVGVFIVMVGLGPELEALLPVGQVVLAVGAMLHIAAASAYLRRMLH